MKFEFDQYVVDIKAGVIGQDFNKRDTLGAMNFLGLACLYASENFKDGELKSFGEAFGKAGRSIYEQLQEYGIMDVMFNEEKEGGEVWL